MENAIVILILVALFVGVVWYLVRAHKRGQACVGCPYAKGCKSTCGSCKPE